MGQRFLKRDNRRFYKKLKRKDRSIWLVRECKKWIWNLFKTIELIRLKIKRETTQIHLVGDQINKLQVQREPSMQINNNRMKRRSKGVLCLLQCIKTLATCKDITNNLLGIMGVQRV